MKRITAGDPAQLGAVSRGDGYNFALFSEHATQVDLCIYNDSGQQLLKCLTLPARSTDGVWHGFVPKLAAPFSYGYRVHGPWAPEQGHRFNPRKLLLDPYAKRLVGEFTWCAAVFDSVDPCEGHPLTRCEQDSGQFVPKALVTGLSIVPARPLAAPVPWAKTVIYEAHVRALTIQHQGVARKWRGTFRGAGSKVMIQYLRQLGVTSVELMPVQSVVSEEPLVNRGLRNFWGYNPLNFFAFNADYANADPVAEFVAMVDALHAAGIEVIIDVVFNHSCESDAHGPSVSFRGIDNASYYWLEANDQSRYVNDTGCGNTLNFQHPKVRQLVLDNLRYLVELGVDGFRFDLGVTLGREAQGFSRTAPMWLAIVNDPVLATRKLISEPWDVGPDGYQLGRMPAPVAEWNDRYRDTVRRAWRGDVHQLPELARRLHGSADIFEAQGRPPHCSINYLAAHDGATLRDLVCYTDRHNLANGESNRDGHADNLAQNFGVEGPSDDPGIETQRARHMRNMLATLLLSQGTPMICAGDEWGHSRRGNNNAYCQDNSLNWLDWQACHEDRYGLRALTRGLLALRQAMPVLWADHYRHRQGVHPQAGAMEWFNQRGDVLAAKEWEQPDLSGISCCVLPSSLGAEGAILAVFNFDLASRRVTLPATDLNAWYLLCDTATGWASVEGSASMHCDMAGRSVQIFLTPPALRHQILQGV